MKTLEEDLAAIAALHERDMAAAKRGDFATLRSIVDDGAVMLPPAGAAWPTLLAASNACLSASGEDTSGLGAPLRTAMPIPVRARSLRPGTTFPCLMSSSIAALSVRKTSAGWPALKRGISAPEGP